MRPLYHPNFKKQFRKLPRKVQDSFEKRLDIFLDNMFHPLLNNHSVDSAYPGWRSINVTGDYRALFEIKEKDMIVFMKIGTHSELY